MRLLCPTAGQRPPLQQATSLYPRPAPASLCDRRQDYRAMYVCVIHAPDNNLLEVRWSAF